MLYGVDVHARYQAGLDIPLLAEQGYSFLVTKASQGLSIPSHSTLSAAQFKARMLSWVEQTRTAGMIPGLYHWLTGDDGAAQAKFFYSLVKEAGGPLLIQLDNEADATWPVTQTWASEWEQLSGGHPWAMYSGKWWWGPRGWSGSSLTPYLWDSHYLTADTDTIPDDPAAFAARIPATWWTPGYGGWPTATILQFTSRGDAGSLGNNVDLNATKLTRTQLLALTGEESVPTAEEIADKVLGRQYRDYVPDADGQRPPITVAQALFSARADAHFARAEVTALRELIAAGATPDQAVLLEQIDERLAVLRLDVRDAVADLGEGGAAQVRGGQ